MKTGCNFIDINNIRAYVEAGMTDARQISSRLNIAPETVQKFVDTMLPPAPPAEPAAQEAPDAPSEDRPSRRRRAAGE
jgi:hypothetical protein